MVNRRKLKVWIVSFVLVIGIFGVYSFFVTTPEITGPGAGSGGDDMVMPDFSGKTSEVGGVGIGKVSVTEFIKRDAVTGKFKEIFGFDKLLNPERKNERWKLEKPYMKSFGKDSSFELRADTGDVQVDTIAGEVSPSEGTLRGDVVITINSQQDGESVQSFIKMDTLDYSSDRSEIATKGPFEFISDDVTLQGIGMVLVYNTALDRIEYFKISDLEYLNIYNAGSLEGDSSDAAVAGEVSAGKDVSGIGEVAAAGDPIEKTKPALKPAPGKSPVKSSKKLPEKSPDDSLSSKGASKEAGTYYQCSFFDDVMIRRLDNLVVKGAESINIVNIFYGRSNGKKSGASSDAGKESLADKKISKEEAVAKDEMVAKEGAVAKEDVIAKEDAIAKDEMVAKDETAVEDDKSIGGAEGLSVDDIVSEAVANEGSIEVAVAVPAVITIEKDRVPEIIVTCRGPLVVVPMAAVDDGAVNEGRPRVMKLEEGSVRSRDEREDGADAVLADEAGPGKTRFDAMHIDYDYTAGRAYAGGPVKFTFYSEPDPNGLDPDALIPMVVNADDNAEYFDDAKKITFNGNVIGVRKDIKVDFVQDNVFYGDQLSVDLYEATPDANELSVKHVAVTGEKVKLKSTRMVGEKIINQIQLFRSRIDYDAVNEIVTATAGAGGRIEINNANAPVKAADDKKKKSLGMEGPCYAVIEKFESLMWLLKGNTIVAKGEESGLTMGYIPIIDGEPGGAIQAAAKHIVVKFDTSKTKRAQLLTLMARDGVHYHEEGGNEFMGDNLFYDAATDLMVVSGPEGQPCFANGVETGRIEYDLGTGKIKTSISSKPGTISTPRKRMPRR